MTDNLTLALVPSDQAIESRVGDETVLLHLVNGNYYGLDAMGTRIWAMLKDGIAPITIRDTLAAEFDIGGDVIAADLRKFLTDLLAHDIVTEI